VIEDAEARLYTLARELRRIPVREDTRALHLRALALKRELGRWRATPPDERTRQRLLAEIEWLTHAARATVLDPHAA